MSPNFGRLLLIVSSVTSLLSLVSADNHHAHVARHEDHAHVARMPVEGTWYHDESHPVHELFRRANTDGVTYPTVGSPAWVAAYPPGKPDSTKLPKAWTDALNAAVAAGKIPNFAPSKLVNGNPTYPTGQDPNAATICSTTVQCKLNPHVVWDAPTGVFASSFDDGPLPPATKLHQFLQNNSVHTTHFYIGSNIVQNPNVFLEAFNGGDDIAVHTWTHPYMTSLSNLDVVAELGWTMMIIHNSTGGRVPKFWRPPYGDSDNRVVAIASEVFGLTTVIWNADTDDWELDTAQTTPAKVAAVLQKSITGPKNPGLIILEHELSTGSVQAFIDAFPLLKQNGWTFTSLARMNNSNAYQNAVDSASPVTPVPDVVGNANIAAPASSSSVAPTSAASASSPSASTTGAKNQQKNGAESWIAKTTGVVGTVVAVAASFFVLS